MQTSPQQTSTKISYEKVEICVTKLLFPLNIPEKSFFFMLKLCITGDGMCVGGNGE